MNNNPLVMQQLLANLQNAQQAPTQQVNPAAMLEYLLQQRMGGQPTVNNEQLLAAANNGQGTGFDLFQTLGLKSLQNQGASQQTLTEAQKAAKVSALIRQGVDPEDARAQVYGR